MNVELITLTHEFELAHMVGRALGRPVHVPRIDHYADGELSICLESPQQFAGKTVFLIQSTGHSIHTMLCATAFVIHELKNAGVLKIIGVLPYFGYSRQEKSESTGGVGNAAVIAQLLQGAGMDELVCVELHTPRVKDFFSIPVHSIALSSFLANHICQQQFFSKNICLVAPDAGARDRVMHIASMLGVEYMVFKKERYGADATRICARGGQRTGGTAIIIDDIIDSAGTAIGACKQLEAMGFTDIYGYFVHPVLAGDAIKKLKLSAFKKIFVSNTLNIVQQLDTIEVFDIHNQLVELIKQLAGK
jgi:ribose-phosphate pyrophosphokinase